MDRDEVIAWRVAHGLEPQITDHDTLSFVYAVLTAGRYREPMAPQKRGGDDDPAWAEPGIGGDRDVRHIPGERVDRSRVARLGDAFWRECASLNLSVPRWQSKPKMYANIRYLLQSFSEELVKSSFSFFRSDAPNLQLDANHPCWEAYFRRRGGYLRAAERAGEGRRAGAPVRNVGDIVVDNQRFRGREPGETVDDPVDTDE